MIVLKVKGKPAFLCGFDWAPRVESEQIGNSMRAECSNALQITNYG